MVERLYNAHDCASHDHHISPLPSDGFQTHRPNRVNPSGITNIAFNLDDTVDKAIQKVYDKKLKAGDIDPELWDENRKKIFESVEQGYGKLMANVEYRTPDKNMLLQLRDNVHTFSAFKNHENVKEMADALVDGNGKPRSFDDFKKAARQINERYNGNWLRSEFEQARGSARMASKWTQFEQNKDILPNLQYRTAGDDRVRDAHERLEGTTKPIDDPFWDEFYPPNGWRCRCTVQQVAGEEREPEALPDENEVPRNFRMNTAKQGQVFRDDHPYFAVAGSTAKTKIQKQLNRLEFDRFDKENYPVREFDESTGGFLVQHASQKPEERKHNLEVGRRFKDQGDRVHLLPNMENQPSPDAEINAAAWEFKRISDATNVRNRVKAVLRKGKKQANNILLDIQQDFSKRELIRGIQSALNQDENKIIENIKLIINNEVVSLSKEELDSGSWISTIEKL